MNIEPSLATIHGKTVTDQKFNMEVIYVGYYIWDIYLQMCKYIN